MPAAMLISIALGSLAFLLPLALLYLLPRLPAPERGTHTAALVQRARAIPKMEGTDLVRVVSTAQAYDWPEDDDPGS